MIRLNKDFHFIEGKWTHIQTTEKDGKFTTYIDGKEFKKDHVGYLSEEHAGDCTCLPFPCSRCHAEDLYGIVSTFTWCKSCEFYCNKTCKCQEKR